MAETVGVQPRYGWGVVGDLVSLVARVGIGLVWLGHGISKIADPSAVAEEFAKMGVFLPTVSAWYATIVEFFVAILLIVGIGLPVAGILLLIDGLGALYWGSGVSAFLHGDSDAQLAFVLGVGSLIAGFHGGRFALDSLLGRWVPILSRSSGRHVGSA
jgi:putative oxidoreductase